MAQLASAKSSPDTKEKIRRCIAQSTINLSIVRESTGRCLHKRPVLDSETDNTGREETFWFSHRGLHRTELAQIRIRGFRALGENLIRIRSI